MVKRHPTLVRYQGRLACDRHTGADLRLLRPLQKQCQPGHASVAIDLLGSGATVHGVFDPHDDASGESHGQR